MTGFRNQQDTWRPRIVGFLYYNFLLHYFYFHPSLSLGRRDLERRKTYRLGITPVNMMLHWGRWFQGAINQKQMLKTKKYPTHWFLLLPWNLVQESLTEIRNLSYFPYFFLFKGLLPSSVSASSLFKKWPKTSSPTLPAQIWRYLHLDKNLLLLLEKFFFRVWQIQIKKLKCRYRPSIAW
jgi:hypothetical protein